MSRARNNVNRFTHIHVENWRNFKEIDVDLQKRVFLVGPNASGKSNLLDLFRFFHDIVATYGGFHEAIIKRGDVESLRSKTAKKRADIVVCATIGNNLNPAEWRYELHINQRQSGPYVKRELVFENNNPKLARPDEKDKKDKKRQTQTFLEQSHANQEFREIAEFFGSIKYLQTIPLLIKEPAIFMDSSYDEISLPEYGSEFINIITNSEPKLIEKYFKITNSILRKAVPELDELSLTRTDWGEGHLNITFKNWVKQHLPLDEKHFSDGTIRILVLIWALLQVKGPLLFEEPELSLHPEIIRFIPSLIYEFQRNSGMQVIATTHSPYLLQDEGIGLDEVLLLIPGDAGTVVKPASDFEEVKLLLEGGLNLADAVFPLTQPEDAYKIPLLGKD